jgi:hypothetical protein
VFNEVVAYKYVAEYRETIRDGVAYWASNSRTVTRFSWKEKEVRVIG